MVRVLSDRNLLSHTSPHLGTLAERRADTETLHRRVCYAASFRPITVPRGASVASASALLLRH